MTDLTMPFVIGLCLVFALWEKWTDSEEGDWKKLVAERHKLLVLCNAHRGRVRNRLVENPPFYHELVIRVDMDNVFHVDWDDITEIKKSRRKIKRMLGVWFMSSNFLKIDEFLLGKGFYKKPPVTGLNGTVWSTYWKENDRCAVEFVVADDNTIRFKLFSKMFKTVDYCCVSECEIKWCYLVHLMELLGM